MRAYSVFVIAVLFAVLGAAVPAAAQGPEDVGEVGTGVPTGTVTEIPAMTVPTVVMDFDAMPAGPTTAADIDAAFPGSACVDYVFTTRAGTGGYNFQTGGGRALAAADDGSGSLVLVDPPAGTFGNADALDVLLSEDVPEFGFEIGDWAGPVNVEVYDAGGLIGSVQVNTAGDVRTHFVGSTTPFNRVVVTTLPDNPPANWVVPTLHCPEGTAQPPVLGIPTLSTWGLIGLALLLLVGGMLLMRHRAAAGA